MALARSERVIKLAGNPTSQQQQAGLQIADVIADADDMVYDYTRTTALFWVEDVTKGFSWAREASEKIAASRLCDEYHDINNKSDKYMKDGQKALDTLRQIGYGSNIDGDNPSFYSTVTPYKASANHIGAGTVRYRSRNAFGGEYD